MEEIKHIETHTDPLLSCCVCRRLLRDAVQLTCLHNCCRCCFAAKASEGEGGDVACGTCGDVTRPGTEQPNGFIDKQVQRYNAIAKSEACSNCIENGGSDKPAMVWCPDCKHSLCEDCLRSHEQFKRKHVTQSLEDITCLEDSCLQSSTADCRIHKKPLEMACVNCEQAKCSSCWIKCKMNKHEVLVAGEDLFDQYIEDLIASISSEEIKLLRMVGVLEKPKSLVDKLKAARVRHLEQIKQRKRRIVDAVDIAYQEMECLTKNVYDSLEAEAVNASAVAERITFNLSECRNYIRRLFELNIKCEIVNQQKVVRERLKVLSASFDAVSDMLCAIQGLEIDDAPPEDLDAMVKAMIGVPSMHSAMTALSDERRSINPEGKLYDRELLLTLKHDKQLPEDLDGLPQLDDIILNKGPRRNSSKIDGDREGGRRLSLPGVGRPRKVIVINRKEVQLHRSDCAYKPLHMKSVAKLTQSEELSRRFRSILNKLAPQNFENLLSSLQALPIDTTEGLRSVINLTFERAVSEAGYSVTYASMCKSISSFKVTTEKPGEVVDFRKLLLTRCQREFEKDLTDEEDSKAKLEVLQKAENEEVKKRLQEEYDMFIWKARRRSLGNIRFIGELFKQKMLTEAIMHDCIVKLLKNNEEDSLECLCGLLKTIGKDIDHEKAKPRNDQYFNQMKKITTQKNVSSRVRFKLLDTIDLRENAWVPRFAETDPTTVEQIHKKVELEAQERSKRMISQVSEECLLNVDVKEALQSIEKQQQPEQPDVLVRCIITSVLERSLQERRRTAHLLSEVINGGLISSESFLKGLFGVTQVADDLVVDVPHIWTYLCELIASMLQADGLQMSSLFVICQPLVEVNRAGELLVKVLRELTRNLGIEKVTEMWSLSGLEWSTFVSSTHDIRSYGTQHRLVFVLSECDSNAHSSVYRKNAIDAIVSSLEELLIRSSGSNEEVFTWHEKNIQDDPTNQRAFIRALVECVARKAIDQTGGTCSLRQDDLQKRAALLVRFIDKNSELELQALFALQSLFHRLQHPANILRSIFDWLYDEDIISEDTFYHWQKIDDPSEREGKGVALESTKQFFTWLQNAESADP